MPTTLTREMAITHKEFFRLLPKAVNKAAVCRQGNQASVTTTAGMVNITLASETVRSLGAMEFPVTGVTMEFRDFSSSDQAAFLERFDLAYRKGGG